MYSIFFNSSCPSNEPGQLTPCVPLVNDDGKEKCEEHASKYNDDNKLTVTCSVRYFSCWGVVKHAFIHAFTVRYCPADLKKEVQSNNHYRDKSRNYHNVNICNCWYLFVRFLYCCCCLLLLGCFLCVLGFFLVFGFLCAYFICFYLFCFCF